MKNILIILTTFTMFFIFSCSMTPHRKETAVKQRIPENWGEGGSVLEREDVPVDSWWHVFNDEKLNALIEVTLENNLDIKMALERIKMYESQFDIQKGTRYPALNASAGYSWTKQPKPGFSADMSQNPPSVQQKTTSETDPSYSLRMGLRFDPDIWGRLKHLEKASVARLKSSEADLQAMYLAIISQIILNYWDIAALEEKLEISHKSIQKYKNQLDIMREKYKTGLAPHVNLEMIKQTLQQTENSREKLLQQKKTAVNNMAVLTGEYPQNLSEKKFYASALPQISDISFPETVPADILQNRHDVVSAFYEMESARQTAGFAKADIFPSLGINLSSGYQIADIANLFSWKYLAASIGAEATQTLFAGGSKLASLDEKKSVFRQSVLKWEKTIMEAFLDVRNSLVTLDSARKIKYRTEQMLVSSEKVSGEIEYRYLRGLETYDRVITSGQTLLSVKNSMIESRKGCLIALVNIYRSTGGQWVKDRD